MKQWLLLPVKPGKDRLNRLCPGQLGDDPAATQDHDDRNAAHGKTARQGRIITGIDLHHCRLAGDFFGNCPHRRCE